MRGMRMATIVITIVIGTAACSGPPNAAERDSEAKVDAYEQLQRQQPAERMDYSPARNTINRWVQQWETPGKLSYVYLYSESGVPLGYYIFEGLPVSYCTSQTRPFTWEDRPGDGTNASAEVPAPGIDGTYSSGAGCDQYYGIEANTGTILEFGGGGISYLLSERPLPVPHQPLGVSVEQAPPR
jgi:hypothetical protein